MERIDKLFSTLGLLSRSECKKAIKKELIKINGVVCKSSDTKVDVSKDEITYKGEVIKAEEYVYYMLNKPEGYITATHDDNQKVVLELIEDTRKDLFAVGRLDKDTTGILLITNDGELSHFLLSPKHHVSKRYEVVVDGILSDSDVEKLSMGIDIGDDKPTLPAEVEIIGSAEDYSEETIALTIVEGRYHQVKRMLSAVGHPVKKLHRSEFGTIKLDNNLGPGQYRPLTADEISRLRYTLKR